MKIKHLTMIVGTINIVLLGLALLLFAVHHNETSSWTRQLIDVEQKLSFDLNNLYALGLQTGQATTNILLNTSDEMAKENYRNAHDNFIKTNDEAIQLSSGKLQEDLKKVKALWDEDHKLKKEIQELAIAGKREEAIMLHVQQEVPKWREVRSIVLDAIQSHSKSLEKSIKDYGRVQSRETFLISFLVAVCLISLFVFVFVIIRKITRPITMITEKIGEISTGNLTVRIDYEGKDEIGMLAADMNKMVESLNAMMNHVMEAANKIVITMDVLRKKMRQTIDMTQAQSLRADQIATAAEEMSATINDISRSASGAAETSSLAMEKAQAGRGIASGAVDTVNNVYVSTVELSTMIEKLNHRVDEIGNIIGVIKDIADQTNLLALNAAIESARAGEQGRGFAVVADEVRKLAERTIKATVEITEKIKAVQLESEGTTKSMGEASGEVIKSTEYIKNVGASLDSIEQEVQKVKDQITQIATAVEEQSSATEEVSKNIEGSSTVEKDIKTLAEDLLHEIKLAEIAEELRTSTAGFKIKGAEFLMLDTAKVDHRIFVNKIAETLSGVIKLDASKLPDHRTCRFGKWYLSEGSALCGGAASFKAVDSPHERIHILAKEAVASYNAGDKEKAAKLFGELENVSGIIMEYLDKIKEECRHKG